MHIVKRAGHLEKFDERKVYATCYKACINASIHAQEAERICERVTKDIKIWIKAKKKVTSNQIFQQMIKTLKKQNKDAAFMYETHRDIA